MGEESAMGVDAHSHPSTPITAVGGGHLMINQTPSKQYWNHHTFWTRFLEDNHFDHWHFVDVFKTIIADVKFRKIILQHFLQQADVFATHCETCQNVSEHIAQFQSTVRKAMHREKPAFLSWRYPPIRETDDETALVSHYTMLVIDPFYEVVLSFDSRGLDYARNFHEAWSNCLQTLQYYTSKIHYQWVDMNYFDIQSLSTYDQFCQTWSILLVLEFYSQDRPIAADQDFWGYAHGNNSGYRFDTIIRFWRYLITEIPEIREACFYEIYRQSHTEGGERVYNRYFSTLEALVHGDNGTFYQHEVGYDEAGYSFLEDFLEVIDEATLHRLLS